ncbi:hypothetical protein ADUPG1_013069 [Aduncisulcus paluster]|uniref:UDENN domain-containing protein n=1 Tax=Aduncisulcus paluster TaxID=2918883 RepID=A0ABQ5K5U8_9EUKA|nr:hypothetical protein ADUPG1_013069 [Aduncisulcus paluster]
MDGDLDRYWGVFRTSNRIFEYVFVSSYSVAHEFNTVAYFRSPDQKESIPFHTVPRLLQQLCFPEKDDLVSSAPPSDLMFTYNDYYCYSRHIKERQQICVVSRLYWPEYFRELVTFLYHLIGALKAKQSLSDEDVLKTYPNPLSGAGRRSRTSSRRILAGAIPKYHSSDPPSLFGPSLSCSCFPSTIHQFLTDLFHSNLPKLGSYTSIAVPSLPGMIFVGNRNAFIKCVEEVDTQKKILYSIKPNDISIILSSMMLDKRILVVSDDPRTVVSMINIIISFCSPPLLFHGQIIPLLPGSICSSSISSFPSFLFGCLTYHYCRMAPDVLQGVVVIKIDGKGLSISGKKVDSHASFQPSSSFASPELSVQVIPNLSRKELKERQLPSKQRVMLVKMWEKASLGVRGGKDPLSLFSSFHSFSLSLLHSSLSSLFHSLLGHYRSCLTLSPTGRAMIDISEFIKNKTRGERAFLARFIESECGQSFICERECVFSHDNRKVKHHKKQDSLPGLLHTTPVPKLMPSMSTSVLMEQPTHAESGSVQYSAVSPSSVPSTVSSMPSSATSTIQTTSPLPPFPPLAVSERRELLSTPFESCINTVSQRDSDSDRGGLRSFLSVIMGGMRDKEEDVRGTMNVLRDGEKRLSARRVSWTSMSLCSGTPDERELGSGMSPLLVSPKIHHTGGHRSVVSSTDNKGNRSVDLTHSSRSITGDKMTPSSEETAGEWDREDRQPTISSSPPSHDATQISLSLECLYTEKDSKSTGITPSTSLEGGQGHSSTSRDGSPNIPTLRPGSGSSSPSQTGLSHKTSSPGPFRKSSGHSSSSMSDIHAHYISNISERRRESVLGHLLSEGFGMHEADDADIRPQNAVQSSSIMTPGSSSLTHSIVDEKDKQERRKKKKSRNTNRRYSTSGFEACFVCFNTLSEHTRPTHGVVFVGSGPHEQLSLLVDDQVDHEEDSEEIRHNEYEDEIDEEAPSYTSNQAVVQYPLALYHDFTRIHTLFSPESTDIALLDSDDSKWK